MQSTHNTLDTLRDLLLRVSGHSSFTDYWYVGRIEVSDEHEYISEKILEKYPRRHSLGEWPPPRPPRNTPS